MWSSAISPVTVRVENVMEVYIMTTEFDWAAWEEWYSDYKERLEWRGEQRRAEVDSERRLTTEKPAISVTDGNIKISAKPFRSKLL